MSDRFFSKEFHSSHREDGQHALGIEISRFVRKYEKKNNCNLTLISVVPFCGDTDYQGIFEVEERDDVQHKDSEDGRESLAVRHAQQAADG